MQRVKILFKQRQHALVQVRSAAQAQSAIMNLQGMPFGSERLLVEMSKYSEIYMMPPGTVVGPGADLVMDFPRSPLHRFAVCFRSDS